MHFFFRLSERKRCQKEMTPAVPVGLLRPAFSLRGRNSLRSDSLPLFTAENCPPLHARRSMPESHAAQTVLCRDVACRVSVQRLMAAPKRRGVKRRVPVLREERQTVRSEASFCRLAKQVPGVAPKLQRLTFFFWYLFFLRQGKKKSTQLNYHLL